MGNEVSKPQLYARISKALPPLAPQYGINENIDWVDKGTKAFASEGDREQFIYGLISLLTSNGTLNLENHDIKLFFSRRHLSPSQLQNPQPNSPPHSHSSNKTPSPWRSLVNPSSAEDEPDDGTRLLATLVAIDEKGVITVKVEPEADGRNVAEAFRAFKRDVEVKLERLLRDVPSAMAGGGPTTGGKRSVERERERPRAATAAAAVERSSVVNLEAPPAYGDVKRG
ncbi:hypothetical protein Q7P36_005845 [Cladosporium allicinum]